MNMEWMITALQRCHKSTLAILSDLSEEQFRYCNAAQCSVADIAWHIAESHLWVAQQFDAAIQCAAELKPAIAPDESSRVLEHLEYGFQTKMASVRPQLHVLDRVIQNEYVGSIAVGEALIFGIDHEAHHRGQIIEILKQTAE